jgi:hypothetical protein
MRIIIEAKAEQEMRYSTEGDWFVDQVGDLRIQSIGLDPLAQDEAFLVALHELVEAKLCRHAGITEAEVDAFDLAFVGIGEPGDAWNCPYRKQHRQAMLIEHMMASFLGLDRYGVIT